MEMELVVLLQNLGFDSSQLCRKSQFFCWTILDDDDEEEEEDEEEEDDDDFPHETNLWPRVGKLRYIVKGSLGGETSVLRTFRMSGKELVKETVSQRNS